MSEPTPEMAAALEAEMKLREQLADPGMNATFTIGVDPGATDGDMTVEEAIQRLSAGDVMPAEDDEDADPTDPGPDETAEFMRVLIFGNEKNAPMPVSNGEAAMLIPYGVETIVPRAIFIALKDSAVHFEFKPV